MAEKRCCDDVALHCHDGLTYKDGRRYEYKNRFRWRWPTALVYRTANRPPLVVLNRYPGIVIGIGFRVGTRRCLSIVWGRSGKSYEVPVDG